MGFIRVYDQRINWENLPVMSTPLNELNLNKMDYALLKHDEALAEMDRTKGNLEDLMKCVRSVVVIEDKLYIDYLDGRAYRYDLNGGSGPTPTTQYDVYEGVDLRSAVPTKLFFIYTEQ